MTETSCREKDAPLLKTHNEGISIILTIHSDDCYYTNGLRGSQPHNSPIEHTMKRMLGYVPPQVNLI